MVHSHSYKQVMLLFLNINLNSEGDKQFNQGNNLTNDMIIINYNDFGSFILNFTFYLKRKVSTKLSKELLLITITIAYLRLRIEIIL